MNNRSLTLTSNVEMSALLKISAFDGLVTPDPKCQLLTKFPIFIDRMAAGLVKTISHSQLPPNINFKIHTNRPPSIFFGELIRIALARGHLSHDVKKIWGFDYDCLPDVPYLLAAIAVWDPESPFIKCLPRIEQAPLNPMQIALNQERVELVLQRLDNGERINPVTSGFNFSEIPDALEEATTIVTSYYFINYKLEAMKKESKRYLELADRMPALKALLREGGVLKMLRAPSFGLDAKTRERATDIMHEPAMQIEGTLPDQSSNVLPPQFAQTTPTQPQTQPQARGRSKQRAEPQSTRRIVEASQDGSHQIAQIGSCLIRTH